MSWYFYYINLFFSYNYTSACTIQIHTTNISEQNTKIATKP